MTADERDELVLEQKVQLPSAASVFVHLKENQITCPDCHGFGDTVVGTYCTLCNGTGRITLQKEKPTNV